MLIITNRVTIQEKRALQTVASVCKEEIFVKNFVLAQMIAGCVLLDATVKVTVTVNVSETIF